MNNYTLQKSIMRRVYLIWMGRLIVNRHTVKAVFLALLVWQFSVVVFVSAVMQNAASGGGASIFRYISYFVGSFFRAEFVAQGIIVGMVVLAAWLLWDTTKNIRPLLSERMSKRA